MLNLLSQSVSHPLLIGFTLDIADILSGIDMQELFASETATLKSAHSIAMTHLPGVANGSSPPLTGRYSD